MEFQVKVVKNGLRGATGKARAAVAKALADEKGWVLADMQQRTPEATGDLKRSETAESAANSITLTAGAGLPDGRAFFVHQGTKYMDPNPYAREAAEAAKPRVAETIGQRIGESLQ